jgi:3-hydroxyacyl-CoA dehydrogenase
VAFDLSRPDLVAAVFGTGTMGRGIAQLCAQAGLATLLFDSNSGAVKQAIAAIDKGSRRAGVERAHDRRDKKGRSRPACNRSAPTMSAHERGL